MTAKPGQWQVKHYIPSRPIGPTRAMCITKIRRHIDTSGLKIAKAKHCSVSRSYMKRKLEVDMASNFRVNAATLYLGRRRLVDVRVDWWK